MFNHLIDMVNYKYPNLF